MECHNWSERLDRIHEKQEAGDVFKTDDLRNIINEIAKNPSMSVASEQYLRVVMLLVQQYESHCEHVVGLPSDVVEILVALADQPANAEVIPLKTA